MYVPALQPLHAVPSKPLPEDGPIARLHRWLWHGKPGHPCGRSDCATVSEMGMQGLTWTC